MNLIDAHCHLEAEDLAEVSPIVDRAREAGLVHAVVIGQFQEPARLRARPFSGGPGRPSSAADDGHSPPRGATRDRSGLGCSRAAVRGPEVSAVGEAGLDYYYDRSRGPHSATLLWRQAALAKRLGKPLVVHVRDAHDGLRGHSHGGGGGGGRHPLLHAGTRAAARRYLDLGSTSSISGVVTYKKTEALGGGGDASHRRTG